MNVSAADAAARYRTAIEAFGAELVEFDIAPLDRTGVPVWTIAAFLPGGRLRNGVGYGDDADAARASAYGECLEVLCGARTPPLTTAPASHPDAVDPIDLILDAGSTYAGEDRAWVRCRRLPAGDEVLVPVEWVVAAADDLPSGYRPLITPITNGLGAGPTFEHALDHALRELVQRDGNSVAYRALDRGLVVDVELPSPAPGVRPLLKAAISDLGCANVYVVAEDDDPAFALQVTACGEAAHPDRDRAIAKALRELCASRARKRFNHGPLDAVFAIAPGRYREHVLQMDVRSEERRALDAMLGWLDLDSEQLRDAVAPTFAERDRIALDDLPHAPDRTTYELLVEHGFDVLVADLSPPGGDVHVVKAVVPGLEVETMSYGRCGARNLKRLEEADLGIVGRGRPPHASALPLRLRDHGDAWFDRHRAQEVLGPLYPLYREPGRHAAALTREQAAA